MPAVCRTCRHPQRAAIDAALVTGSTRKVGSAFGVHFQAIARHKARCIPEKLKKAIAEHREKIDANQLLEYMLEVKRDTDALRKDALAKKVKHVEIARIDHVRGEHAELIGRQIGAFPREGAATSTTTIDARTQIIIVCSECQKKEELPNASTEDVRIAVQKAALRVDVLSRQALTA